MVEVPTEEFTALAARDEYVAVDLHHSFWRHPGPVVEIIDVLSHQKKVAPLTASQGDQCLMTWIGLARSNGGSALTVPIPYQTGIQIEGLPGGESSGISLAPI